ncbi:MAG: sugar ABC transporter ATP-binding protein [Curvibacter sp. RIFCSPHIGHO2_12_FULL_63_18]|uniref:sugar ABC transporter ATP-binding protein n=1 Tax=Rhodoferax sp. TaxID=50421 RepID=UPI0008CA13BB|nr:sugar ABC transporter ATP-binding protein [Rhodoferax sp.]OGO99737.1 MAG: sugar ABC transporter ATP-binding protein [Curvibacter sp. RIFCSPHIGHO2_12_FULL_63_18]OGP00402.1 MAG: sugar ABC transporter ATP-binding protein [Curvibacter sp. GWA2_63_95]HCX82041.1 sugar ABC transporter ATP-binding protein [Rhodoferax sp.]
MTHIPPAAPAVAPVLELSGVAKQFGPVRALSGVNLRLFPGEVHALMGQNGAGKSTLIKVLTGVYPADQGDMRLNGQSIRATSTLDAQRLGISTVYQEVNLCPNLSVAENIFAGRYPRKGAAGLWSIDWQRMHREARELLARLNLDIDVSQTLSSYSVAVQQMVAIARGLSISAQVLILDEPTSSLDDEEVERLYGVLRQLRDQGMAILFVTHFLDQVYALCDRITVLRNGELVGEYPAAELGHNALIAAMVGRELAAAHGAQHADGAARAAEPEWLQTQALNRRGHVKAIDLGIRRGEVVGLGGLLGSGRTELARLLFGLDRSDGGEILLGGKPVRMDSPATAIQMGLALCPEDRKAEGIIAELSVRENIVLALQARQGLWPAIGRVQQTTLAEGYVKALGIKTADVDTPIGQLSGGNQQKAVLARWLATQPSLLILDEPTRGIDIAAKQEIMNEILALAKQGMAVLFISSEMEEVVRVSDRIVVLRDRAKVGELPGGTNDHAVYAMIAGQA